MKAYGRKKRLKISTCVYADEVTDLLARRVRSMEEYKDCSINCYGPFGIDAQCSLSVKREDQIIGWITVTRRENGFVYDDNNAPLLHTYPKGSIGDLNGLNIPKKQLPTEIEEALRIVFTISN